jgi:hypothetical protein
MCRLHAPARITQSEWVFSYLFSSHVKILYNRCTGIPAGRHVVQLSNGEEVEIEDPFDKESSNWTVSCNQKVIRMENLRLFLLTHFFPFLSNNRVTLAETITL